MVRAVTQQPGTPASSRSLVGYFALPRPGDLRKAWIVVIGFLLGMSIGGLPTGRDVTRGLLVWFAVEYLAYQARYQWNDIRGFWSDQAHPDRDGRGRLPGPVERGRRHIALSRAVIAARLLGIGAVVLLLPGPHLTRITVTSVAAVFAVAVAYEAVRSRAAVCTSAARPGASVVVLWLVSGAGYCVRGLTGMALAVPGGLPAGRLVVAGGAFWCAGVMFVMTRWAVESVSFAARRGDRIEWRATRAHARGHLLPLSRWIPQPATPPSDLRQWRPLRSSGYWLTPWNAAFLAALEFAWLTGSAGVSARPGWADVAIAAGVVPLVAAVLARSSGAVGWVAALAVLLGGLLLGRAGLAQSWPMAAVCVLYLLCRRQSLAEIAMSDLQRLRARAAAVAGAVARRVDGPRPVRSRLGEASSSTL